MKTKAMAIAASLFALLPNAQVGTTLAVTGIAVAVPVAAEAKKSKNERVAARQARRQARRDAQDARAASKLQFKDMSHEATQEPLDNNPPPYNPGGNPPNGGGD